MALSRQKGLEKLISTIKKTKANIKSVHADYPDPDKLSFPGNAFNAKSFTPDVVAEHKDHTDFYVFETGTSKKSLGESMQKWILFSSVAKRYRGDFYVCCDESKVDKFEEILAQKRIQAELMPLKA